MAVKEKIILSEAEIRAKLLELPKEITRTFETTVVDYAVGWDLETPSKMLDELKVRNDLTPDEDKLAFALFCVLINAERRQKNRSNEEKLLNEFRAKFESQHPFFRHCELLIMLYDGSMLTNKEKIKVLELAEKNKDALYENNGASHAFAEAVAKVYESLLYDEDEGVNNQELLDMRSNYLADAEAAVEDAIRTNPDYAKYYCTRGRLRSLRGDNKRALQDIDRAIDLEDNKRSDYTIRINTYTRYVEQIKSRKQMINIEQTLEAKTKEYEVILETKEKEMLTKNMEFLGLFSGIVSFTIGSISISTQVGNMDVLSIAGLIIVLMGALMGVFAGFGIILHGLFNRKAVRNLLVLALGVLIIIGGVYYCFPK